MNKKPAIDKIRTNAVCITTNACNTFDCEIEGCQPIPTSAVTFCQPRWFQEGNYEWTKTAVDVQAKIESFGKSRESFNIVLISIWEIYTRTNKLKQGM